MLYLIMAVVFIAVFSTILLLFLFIGRNKNPLIQRIQEMQSGSSPNGMLKVGVTTDLNPRLT